MISGSALYIMPGIIFCNNFPPSIGPPKSLLEQKISFLVDNSRTEIEHRIYSIGNKNKGYKVKREEHSHPLAHFYCPSIFFHLLCFFICGSLFTCNIFSLQHIPSLFTITSAFKDNIAIICIHYREISS